MRDESLENHKLLSGTYAEFLRFAINNSNLWKGKAISRHGLPQFAREYEYALQSFPIFIDSEKHAELGRISGKLLSLVRLIPSVEFSSDYNSILSHFRGVDRPYASKAFSAPTGLNECMGRCDIILTADGPKLIEFNLGPGIGGWQIYLFESAFRNYDLVRSFCSPKRQIKCISPIVSMIEHAIQLALSRPCEGVHRIGVAVSEQRLKSIDSELVGVLGGVASLSADNVKIDFFSPRSKVEYFSDEVSIDGQKVDVVLLYLPEQVIDPKIFRAFNNGHLKLLNSPAASILSNKRSVAILSEWAHADSVPLGIRDFVSRYVPWTRVVANREVEFCGDAGPMEKILDKYQHQLVLKPDDGYHGRDVVIGKKADSHKWRQAVHEAISNDNFIVQEYCPSLKYLAQCENDLKLHDFVWGCFVFGDKFGGSWVRMLPSDDAFGVINSFNGATEGIVFDI